MTLLLLSTGKTENDAILYRSVNAREYLRVTHVNMQCVHSVILLRQICPSVRLSVQCRYCV